MIQILFLHSGYDLRQVNLYINKLFENMGNLLYEEEVVDVDSAGTEEEENSAGSHQFRITGVQSLLGEKLPFQDVSRKVHSFVTLN